MAWKLYIKFDKTETQVQGTFKTEEDAKLYYRRNKEAYRQKDGSYGTPITVEVKKGRK